MTDKNALASALPFVYLIETEFGGQYVRLANYTSDILFNGNTFYATSMQIGMRESSLNEKVTRLTITLSNASILLGALLDDMLGGTGSQVKIYLVWFNGTSWQAVASGEFTILSARVTNATVSIEVGIPNPLNTIFPRRIYVARTCPWRFKSPQCGYVGSDTTCDHTLEDCTRKFGATGHLRFGGFPGLTGGFVVVRW